MASIIALGEGAFQLSRILGYWTSFRLYGVLIRNYNYISNAIGGGGDSLYASLYFCISVVGTELGMNDGQLK